jgi:hypothetical protein
MENRSLLREADGGFRIVVPETDESVRGYMHRLAEAYGLPSVRPIMTAISVGGPRPFSAACARRLAELGGVPLEVVSKLGGFDGMYVAGVNTWSFGAERTTHYPAVNCRILPVCSECLRERAIAPAFVHLSAMTVCPAHLCRLLAVCPDCRSPLRANRPRLGRCHCKLAFREVTATQAPANELLISSAVYARVGGMSAPGLVVDSLNGQINLAVLDLDDLLYLHWAIGYVLPNPRMVALGTRRHLTQPESVAATNALVKVLRTPKKIVPLIRAWLRLFVARDGKDASVPFGLFRSILKRLIAIRGLSVISSLISLEMDRVSSRHGYRLSVGPRQSAQMALFEPVP